MFFFFCYIWLQPCLQTTLRILLNCLGILAVKSAAHTRENCWRTLRVTGRTCTKKKKKECRLGCFVKATKYNVLCPRQLQNLIEIGENSWNKYDSLEGSPWKAPRSSSNSAHYSGGGACCSWALVASGCHVLFHSSWPLLCAVFLRRVFRISLRLLEKKNLCPAPLSWVVGVVVVNERAFLERSRRASDDPGGCVVVSLMSPLKSSSVQLLSNRQARQNRVMSSRSWRSRTWVCHGCDIFFSCSLVRHSASLNWTSENFKSS